MGAILAFETREQADDRSMRKFIAEARAARDAERRRAELVECPYFSCLAQPGERCQSESGRPLLEPHEARFRRSDRLTGGGR